MARQFPGSASHYLNTELHAARGSTSNISMVFSVKLLAQAAAVSVCGMVKGSGDGFGFRLNQSGANTILQLHNNLSGRSPAAQTILNFVKFIAVVNDVSANECRFYIGDTAASMVSLGSAGTALTFDGSAMPDMVIGARNNNGSIEEPLTAVLDQFSIFFDTVLTLPQIKSVAACGSAMAASSRRYYQLNGGSPETDSSPNADHAVIVGTVPSVDDICSAGTSATKARFFDGIDDRLDTGLSAIKGSTNKTSGYMWIQATIEALGTRMGAINALDADQRLDFRTNLSSVLGEFLVLDLFAQGGAQRVAIPEIVLEGIDRKMFVAFVNDVDANRFRFFWGFTADTVVEVDTADFTTATTAVTFKQISDSSCKVQIGALGREGNTAQFFANPAIIDSAALVFDKALTLAELKQRAACGAGAEATYWPIDGTDPEPGINAIHGTTVVDSICGVGVPSVAANAGQLLVCI